MAEYLHGAYGQVNTAGARLTNTAEAGFIVFGTAPVNTIEDGARNVNVPIEVSNMAEAEAKFGYSEDWAKYTLCEAFHVFFEEMNVGPLVVINVLDPDKAGHKGTAGTASLTPVGGRVTIASAEDIIMDSVVVKAGSGQSETTKQKGVDYEIGYSIRTKSIVIAELTTGALGTDPLSITYDTVNPAAVTGADLIGSTDGRGLNTGLYAVKDVYQKCNVIPGYLLAPGWTQIKTVHDAMAEVSKKINKHWDAIFFSDIPILDNSTPVTIATARTWKATNGYNKANEKACYPMTKGTDGKKYHMSTLYAGNFLGQLIENEGVPYHTASNTICGLIAGLWLGADYEGRVFDDSIINEYLCKYGISSAVYMGGAWRLWGAHSAEYPPETEDSVNVGDTALAMLYYVSNDFQARRVNDVDQPLSANDIQSIVAEEQTRLDALVAIGALSFAEAYLNADKDARSDMYLGNYSFTFRVTTTPLAKSLKAIVNWVADGFETYFAQEG